MIMVLRMLKEELHIMELVIAVLHQVSYDVKQPGLGIRRKHLIDRVLIAFTRGSVRSVSFSVPIPSTSVPLPVRRRRCWRLSAS
jgi:hypothetical protein